MMDEASGQISATLVPCLYLPDAPAPAGTGLQITISASWKTGAGTVALLQDTTPLINCADGTTTTGPLTLTPLANEPPNPHNEDSAQSKQVLGHQDPCSDYEELGADKMRGGLRDPFNPYDFFDFNGDGYIDTPNDIMQVMLRYSANPSLPYDVRADRGRALGPYAWNREGPNGTIDAPNDIMAVKLQYHHDCRPAP